MKIDEGKLSPWQRAEAWMRLYVGTQVKAGRPIDVAIKAADEAFEAMLAKAEPKAADGDAEVVPTLAGTINGLSEGSLGHLGNLFLELSDPKMVPGMRVLNIDGIVRLLTAKE